MSERSASCFTTQISAFLEENAKNVIHAQREILTVLRDGNAKASENGYTLSLKLVELQDHLQRARRRATERKQTFEEDFEELLRQEGIRKISVHEGRISIDTKRIFQMARNNQHDIGQLEIILDFTSYPSSRQHINFYPGQYRGTHSHPHAQPNNTCFGMDNETGLNIPIEKLMADFNLVALVPLLLSFLRFDETMPPQHSYTAPYKIEYDRAGYASEKEKEMAKRAFVELCVFVEKRNSTYSLEREISALEAKIRETDITYATTRNNIEEIKNYVRDIENDIPHFPEKAEEEAEKLLAHKEITAVVREESKLLIRFSAQGNNFAVEFGRHPPKIASFPPGKRMGRFFNDNGTMRIDASQREHVVGLQKSNDVGGLFEFVLSMLLKSMDAAPLFKGGDYEY